MLIGYFDSNIYQHLRDAGPASSPALHAIASAVQRRELRVFVSDSNLVELGGFERDPAAARRSFELLNALCMRRPARTVQDIIQREVRRLRDPSVELRVEENPKSLNHHSHDC